MVPGSFGFSASVLAAITRSAPARANVSATCRPIPRDPPVMIATFPSSAPISPPRPQLRPPRIGGSSESETHFTLPSSNASQRLEEGHEVGFVAVGEAGGERQAGDDVFERGGGAVVEVRRR